MKTCREYPDFVEIGQKYWTLYVALKYLFFLFPATSNHHKINLFKWMVSGCCDGPEV